MTLELTLLAWSVVILFMHIVLQSVLQTRDLGNDYNIGPRDDERKLGALAGRADRALRNFLETYPAFVALALIAGVAGVSNGFTVWGAVVYFVCRIVYIPLYLLGIPRFRSLAFAVASLGLILMLVGLAF